MPQPTPPSALDKFATAELRDLAAGRSTRSVRVLIQPDLPVRRLEMGRLADERVAATRAFLATVLGNDPHWLGAARTFAVRATPAQLRAIAASPMVRTIWPDRTHRLTTGPAS